jgi:hypothetical protein
VRADRRTARTLLALSHGMGAFFVLLRWRTLERNLDAATWSEAGSLSLGTLVTMVLIAAPFALLGWWLGGFHPELPRPVRELVRFALPADGQLVWVGHESWAVARVVGPVLVAAGGALTALRFGVETLVVGSTLVLPLLPATLGLMTALAVGLDRPWASGLAGAVLIGWLLAVVFPLA